MICVINLRGLCPQGLPSNPTEIRQAQITRAYILTHEISKRRHLLTVFCDDFAKRVTFCKRLTRYVMLCKQRISLEAKKGDSLEIDKLGIAAALSQLRNVAGIQVGELSKLSGISRQTIHKAETTGSTRLSTLIALTEAIGAGSASNSAQRAHYGKLSNMLGISDSMVREDLNNSDEKELPDEAMISSFSLKELIKLSSNCVKEITNRSHEEFNRINPDEISELQNNSMKIISKVHNFRNWHVEFFEKDSDLE